MNETTGPSVEEIDAAVKSGWKRSKQQSERGPGHESNLGIAETVGLGGRLLKPERPVTVERYEKALDELALLIEYYGKDGPKLLPLFDRLQRELDELRARERSMDAVRNRVKRLKGHMAEPL